MKRERYCRFVLQDDIAEAGNVRESVSDAGVVQAKHAAKNPGGFEQYGFSDPNWSTFENGACGLSLLGIIPNNNANHDISIDRCHDAALSRA